MRVIKRVAAIGMLLVGMLVANVIVVGSVQARCCDRFDDGCDGASEKGCAMGNAQDMFFPDPCECNRGVCEDTEDNNGPCGDAPPPGGDCGDGDLDSGEECDDGSENGSFLSCCAVNCDYKADGALCEDGTFCDGLGACNGSGTCVENAGGETCPEPGVCDEDERECSITAQTPAVSTGALVTLATTMLLGAGLLLRRRRQNSI